MEKNVYDGCIMRILAYTIIFCINPLLALIAYYCMCMKNDDADENNKFYLLHLCILCSCFVSLINMVKVPDNDLVWYLESFQFASDFSIWEFMFIGSNPEMEVETKEPMYGIIVWLLNWLLNGNTLLFKFFFSFINYLLLTGSVVLFARKLKIFPFWMVVTGVYLMCFIPYIFTMSLQLLRQILACSLFVFLMVRCCFFQKKDYLLMLLMVLIHSTAWFFIPFLLIPAFGKSIKEAKVWYVFAFAGIIGIRFLAEFIGGFSFLSSFGVLEYAIERASSETTFELEKLSMIKILMIVVIFLYTFYLAYKSDYKNMLGMKRFATIICTLCFFIILNRSQTELSNRFFFYTFPIMPFLLMMFFNHFKIDKYRIGVFVSVILFFFCIFLDVGTWTYAIPYTVWFTPPLMYFL